MTVTLDFLYESAGAAASTGTVSIPSVLGEDLTVTLESNNTAKATVPASVTITTGNTSADFPIDVVDNLLADGDATVTLTVTAAGYLNATQNITVVDDDAAIQVEILDSSIAEDAGPDATSGTVILPGVTPVPVTVNLVSNKPDEATVPASVTVAAGEQTANFQVAAVDDLDLDGDQSVTINATAEGYTAGWSVAFTVTDNEVAPPSTLSAGAIAFTGFNADGNKDLAFVALVNIPAGEVIYMTDNEWNGSEIGNGGAFNDSNEGSLTWTAPAGGVAAGEVVLLNDVADVSRSASVGALVEAGGFNLGASGDTVYAYQGTALGEPTVFLAVIGTRIDNTDNTGLSANQIIQLTSPTGEDIAAYNGSRSNKPTYAGYLDSLADTANWITENGTDVHTNTTPPNVPFDTTAFTLGAGTDYATWAAANAPGETPDLDNDGDGLANGVEYFMGTPGNAFTVNPGVVEAAGVKTISWPMNPEAIGVSYRVLISETLAAGAWTAASASVVGSDLVLTLPTATAKLFVRLEVTVSGS